MTNQQQQQLGFMLENERGWVSSSLFFYSLVRLGIDPAKYYIPVGVISPEFLADYTDTLIWDLAKANRNEYYTYAFKIAQTLKRWAENRHIVHIVL